MLTLSLTLENGETHTLIVKVVQYVRVCPYNEPHEFRATNPRQIFCCDSHKVMHFKKHKLQN